MYLDFAGTTVYSTGLLEQTSRDLSGKVYGNPHSRHPASQELKKVVEQTRSRVLKHFNLSPKIYDVIFTSGATGAIKLGGEMFPWKGKTKLWYLRESHTSILGLRAMAQHWDADVGCFSKDQVQLVEESSKNYDQLLIAYPGQCNQTGERFPLKDWCERIRRSGNKCWILLDAASLATSCAPDLSSCDFDFIALSFYKIFGYPSGLGALIVKKSRDIELRKDWYFGGGTVDAIAFEDSWQIFRPNLHERFEDGTMNFLAVAALSHAFSHHELLFGSFQQISKHCSYLFKELYREMIKLTHPNGRPLCKLHIDDHSEEALEKRGPILNFNLMRNDGSWIGYGEVERLAAACNLFIRAGGFCNPGASQNWLDMSSKLVQEYAQTGHVCSSNDPVDIIEGKPVGSVRVSLGAMTTRQDIQQFLTFLKDYFIEAVPFSLPIPSAIETATLISAWICNSPLPFLFLSN